MQLTKLKFSQKVISELWHRVCVYGTLKKGNPNHFRMLNDKNGASKFLSNAITKEKYPLVVASSGNIPFLLNKKGTGHHLHVEIYEVNNQMKEFLDKFENVGVLYDIEEIEMVNEKEEDVVAPVYVLNGFRKELLELPMIQSYTSFHTQNYVLPGERKSTINEVAAEVKAS